MNYSISYNNCNPPCNMTQAIYEKVRCDSYSFNISTNNYRRSDRMRLSTISLNQRLIQVSIALPSWEISRQFVAVITFINFLEKTKQHFLCK